MSDNAVAVFAGHSGTLDAGEPKPGSAFDY